MQAAYDSACGTYRCGWKLISDDTVQITAEVPFGGQADLVLPYAPAEVLANPTNPVTANVQDGICILEPGIYEITYKMTKSLKVVLSLDTTCRELLKNQEIKAFLQEENLNIPMQYLENTVREMQELFPAAISEDQMKRLEEFLNLM